MALFNYRAVDADGHTVAGRIDAMNIVDLEMRLRRMDLDLVKGEPVSNKSLLGTHTIPRRELIHFCFHLEHLVRVKVPILEGLTDLRDSLETRASEKSSPASWKVSKGDRPCRRPWMLTRGSSTRCSSA